MGGGLLSAPCREIKVRGKWVDDSDAIKRPVCIKVLAQDDGNLIQPSCRPNLRIPKGELVQSNTSCRFEHDQPCYVENRPTEHIVVDPLSGLFHRHALRQLAGECDEEFSEDLSRQDPTLRARQEVQHC